MTEENKTQEQVVQPNSVAKEEDPLSKLTTELNDWKDKYLRSLAESENMRKRLQKEKIESQSYAIQNVIVDFLQPLDHFEQALKKAEAQTGDVRTWAQGFEMILSQFKQILADHGVSSFDSKGKTFDPHEHEAIETEETLAHPPGTVIEEFVRGYKLSGRVIRPAKVKVATTPSQGEK